MRAHPLYLAVLVATGVALAAQSGAAQRPEDLRPDTVPVYLLDPIVLEARIDDLATIATTASQGIVGNRDFRPRPLVREGELLSPAGRARGRDRARPFPSGRTATGPDYSLMGGLT